MNRTIIISIILLITTLSGRSQTYILDSLRPYLPSVVNEMADTLAYADSSANFNKFFGKLDSIHKGLGGNLHIFHIGGSHIQADVYSNKLRNYFQLMNNGAMGQRGFIFPYNLASTNNPANYRVVGNRQRWQGYRSSVRSDSATWGLSGITAHLTDSIDTLRITTGQKLPEALRNRFSKVRFFVDNPCLSANYKVTDSINVVIRDTCDCELGYRELTLSGETDALEIEVSRNDSLLVLYGIELMSDRKGIQYTSVGVNGASFESYSRCTLFEKQLRMYTSDLFIISIGTNDAYTPNFDTAKFENYYREFMSMVLRVNPNCAILLTVPNDNYYKRKYPNKNTEIQQEIIHRLAKEYRMAAWDLYEIMGGLGSSQKWYLKHLMPRDRVHFTATGYSLIGDLLLKALTSQWEKVTGAESGSLLESIISIEI